MGHMQRVLGNMLFFVLGFVATVALASAVAQMR